jgi:metal-responsive CopG/Arc/MetJ family transcriptional regulator
MKTAISIPQGVFETAEKYAAEKGMSRSKLYTKAIQAYLDNLKAEEITRQLNESIGDDDTRLDPQIRKAQARSLKLKKW